MKKPIIIILHVGYWALFLILLIILFTIATAGLPAIDEKNRLTNIYITVCFAIVPGVSCFYSFYFFIFNRFLYRKRILALFIWGIVDAIICSLFGGLLATFLIGPFILFGDGLASAFDITVFTSLIALLNGGMGLVVKGFISWYTEIKIKEDLNKKNYEMELALLKSRINPHFLFNTINNIDILIEKDAAKASIYLNKLSDIMRFMLYETKPEMIALSRELEYIEKFVELQKIRTSNKNFVNFMVEGYASGVMIAPMIFIPFIENAFKHAENKLVGNVITIKFVFEKNAIIFYCENSYNKYENSGSDFSGLGNELIKKRLALLYGNRHKLQVNKTPEMYKVKLIMTNYED